MVLGRAEIRVLDEVISFVDKAKIESRQVDRATAGMGHCPEEDVVVTRRAGAGPYTRL